MKIKNFLDGLKAKDRSHRTIQEYGADLRQFQAWYEEAENESLHAQDVGQGEVTRYKDWLRKNGYKPATINRRLAALRSYYRWSRARGSTTLDPTEGIRDKRQQTLAPRALGPVEVAQLYAGATGRIRRADSRRRSGRMSPSAREARRDLAVLTTLLGTGLRLSELAAITLDDLATGPDGAKMLIVRSGKGDKRRKVPLSAEVWDAVEGWLLVRPGAEHDSLFVGRRGAPLGKIGIQRALKKIAKTGGLPPELVSPRILRHTFAKSLIDAGVTLEKSPGPSRSCLHRHHHPLHRTHRARSHPGRSTPWHLLFFRAKRLDGALSSVRRILALSFWFETAPVSRPPAEGLIPNWGDAGIPKFAAASFRKANVLSLLEV